MNFICQCGFESELKVLRIVITHMSECTVYKNNSLVQMKIQKQKSMFVEQLLILKADLLSQVEEIDQIIDSQKFKYQSESRSQDNLQITQQITAEEKLRKLQKKQQISVKDKKQKIITKQEDINLNELNVNGKHPLEVANPKTAHQNSDIFKGFQEINDNNPIQEAKNEIQGSQYTNGDCLMCGHIEIDISNRIFQIICGHSMCQRCFLQMYKDGAILMCPKQNCAMQINREYISKAVVNYETRACHMCQKIFASLMGTRTHAKKIHLGEEKFYQLNPKYAKKFNELNQDSFSDSMDSII